MNNSVIFSAYWKKNLLTGALLLVVSILAAHSFSADSSNYYVIKNNYPFQALFPYTEILQDDTGQLTIDDILAPSFTGSFLPLQDSAILSATTVWLRIKIKSDIDIHNWWLLFKNNEYEPSHVVKNDFVDAYFVQNGQIIHHTRTGAYIPAGQKEISHPNTVARIFANFSAGETKTIYFKLSGKPFFYTQVELRDPALGLPAPSKDFISHLALITAFAFILSCYVLIFFFFTKDYSYLYLFGVFSFLLMHYQILHPYRILIDWFFPEHPNLVLYAWVIFTRGNYIFFIQFGRTLIDAKTNYPRLDKFLLWLVRLMFASLVLGLLMVPINSEPNGPVEVVVLAMIFIFTIGVFIYMATLPGRLIKYFTWAGLWLIFFSLYGIAWNAGLLPFFEFTNPWIVSQGGFMMINAVALARKLQINERAKSEVEKIKAIESVKSRFFANISHEFRTPLSLILGPINQSLESIPSSEAIDDDTEIPVKGRHLKIMRRNSLRLQNLVDQILDLSKLDQGKMALQVRPGDLIAFIRSIVFSFESMAERKHIHFKTNFPQSIEGAWFDADKLEKILSNLLSNAFKFTPEHGMVSVRVEDTGTMIKIVVSDTGGGIKQEESEKIFDRFYQIEGNQDQGTGIGLALVKELIDLWRGQILMDSVQGKGTTFKIMLPYLETDFKESERALKNLSEPKISPDYNAIFSHDLVTKNSREKGLDLPLLLVVEDNPDLRQYISERLNNHFKIIQAKDGQEGWKLAQGQLPDLIVSDVMMPKMNGMELCALVKKDIKTSHIPVILLTAKAAPESKIKGLETGADDYLTKPFDGRELLVRAKNLIEQRAQLRKKYAGELKIRPTEVMLNSMDEKFIKRVMTEIERNMSNEFYSVEELANSVGFSRSQLSRKVKALTEKSPNQLIRIFRLTRAKELLEQKTGTVSEIAFQVGYSNLSYFSKSFKDAFGRLPSDI